MVQASLKLVLEPIFEAGLKPVSYGFRPLRRAHDTIAEIHFYGTHGYRWVLDADIEACFDSIDHTALMDRVRVRVKDKRVLRLVKAFLEAGVLTEDNNREDTLTGTPQGGILSPHCWRTSPCRRSTSTCPGRGSRTGRWPPDTCAGVAVPLDVRTDESSATRTTSSS
ncbi:reverse transcriptase domain-containing protein [Streptomyces prasinus]|uniref:reverse transcriptase domain-containing protein n=1 Tax=Streptomyces prasinus TaxID=67345 RepID=UPI00364107A1